MYNIYNTLQGEWVLLPIGMSAFIWVQVTYKDFSQVIQQTEKYNFSLILICELLHLMLISTGKTDKNSEDLGKTISFTYAKNTKEEVIIISRVYGGLLQLINGESGEPHFF